MESDEQSDGLDWMVQQAQLDGHYDSLPQALVRIQQYRMEIAALINEREQLKALVNEVFEILEAKEESDNGHMFHPTRISSCRCMTSKRLGEIDIELRSLIGRPRPKSD